MAYPTIDKPYGLKPVNLVGGLPYSGSTRMVPIASGYNTSIYYGDVVQIGSGVLAISAMSAASSPGTAVAGTIGVFLGCSYTNPSTNQKIFTQYWAAGTVTQDAVAYVVDDNRAVFKAAMTVQGSSLANTGTTIGYVNPAFVGSNLYPVFGNGGVVASGDSLAALSGAVITSGTSGNTRQTSALPFRVVQVVPDTAVAVAAVASTSGSSTTVTLTAANTAISPGMQLICPTGTGTLAGQYSTVTNVNGTAVTVASAVTLASGSNVSFVGYPEVLVTWNHGFHSYTNATGA